MNDVYAHCDAELRRLDPERRLTTRFLPPAERRRAVAIHAFNLEIARVRDIVSEPTIGLIRLQWWRDALAEARSGRPRAHPVVQALTPILPNMRADTIEAMITARERDLDDAPFERFGALIDHARATAGAVLELTLGAIEKVDVESREAGAKIGEAWGLIGALRAEPFQAAAGRGRLSPDLDRAAIASRARDLIAAARRLRVDRRARGPLLLAELGMMHLARARDGVFAVEQIPLGLAPLRLAWLYVRRRF